MNSFADMKFRIVGLKAMNSNKWKDLLAPKGKTTIFKVFFGVRINTIYKNISPFLLNPVFWKCFKEIF